MTWIRMLSTLSLFHILIKFITPASILNLQKTNLLEAASIKDRKKLNSRSTLSPQKFAIKKVINQTPKGKKWSAWTLWFSYDAALA